jgi:plastocyanin
MKMYATAILSVLSALAISGTSALPTTTTGQPPSNTVSLTGVTHSVIAGLAGLHFDPNNVVANVGDIVEYHYLPKNHSVAQSSFQNPCVPINNNAIFSGFFPTTSGQNVSVTRPWHIAEREVLTFIQPDVFQIVVNDTNPVWIYCAQTDGSHCQNGMASVINQKYVPR